MKAPCCPTCHRRLPRPRKPKPNEAFGSLWRPGFWRELGVAFAFGVQWPWPYAGTTHTQTLNERAAYLCRAFTPGLLRVSGTGHTQTERGPMWDDATDLQHTGTEG